MNRLSSLAQESASALRKLLSPTDSSPESNTGDTVIHHSGLVSRRPSGRFTIAILARLYVPIMQETLDGITRHLNEHAPGQFTCVLFDGRGDEKLLFNYTTQIIQNYTMPYDAIITIGAQASQVAARTSLLLNIRIPIIFSWVHNPAHLGIIYPGRRTGGNITGIATEWPNYQEALSTLVNLKKGVREVLLPYNPRGMWVATQISELSQLLNSNGIRVHLLPVPHRENMAKEIHSKIYNIDTIITTRDDTIIQNMDSIVSMCNDYGVTIYSSELKSVEQGAAIGYAVKDVQTGKEIAEYILQLFNDRALPHELPVKTAENQFFVGINKKNSPLQGLELSQEDLETVHNRVVFSDSNTSHDETETST